MLAGLVVIHLFKQRGPDTLDDGAPDLTFNRGKIDNRTAVSGDDIFDDIDEAGTRIDLDNRDVSGRRNRGAWIIVARRTLNSVIYINWYSAQW